MTFENGVGRRQSQGDSCSLGVLVDAVARLQKTVYEKRSRSIRAMQSRLCALSVMDHHSSSGVTYRDLCFHMKASSSTIRGFMTKFRKEQLVVCRIDGNDGRTLRIYLSRRGRSEMERLKRAVQRIQDQSMEDITAKNETIFWKALSKMRKNLRKMELDIAASTDCPVTHK